MKLFLGLAPTVVMLAVLLGASAWARRHAREGEGGARDYFIGGRDLGGFVLAMTTVATYSSVSSFVGGPGVAWSVGYGWIYMSTVQVTVLFLALGVLGKKMALAARRIDAVTVIDVIRHRYGSDALAEISAAVIVIFFAATMVAQFVGGARLFSASTGLDYRAALALFGVTVVVCTALGGWRGVVLTDAICAVAMLVGMVLLMAGLVRAGGGWGAVMERVAARPEMTAPISDAMPMSLYISQWMLVGLFTIGLPQSAVRCLAYRDTRSLHGAIVVGTIVIGAMNIGMNLAGVLARGAIDGTAADWGGADAIIPCAITRAMSPALAGVTLVAPVAASISTISSLLLSASSSLVRDIALRRGAAAGRAMSERAAIATSRAVTLAIGAAVFAIALDPPDLIWVINMFAFGGLESAFVWTITLGLFWRRANKTGALLATAGGAVTYCAATAMGIRALGLHQILIGVSVSLALMVAGSLLGKRTDEEILKVYF